MDDQGGPRFADLPAYARFVRLEIPSDINTLRASEPVLAACWTSAVSQAFLAAFASGYRAVGFRDGYVLERGGMS
jgi:predicted GNAT superfamily acetyltransferase